jgi:hypothetical protein
MTGIIVGKAERRRPTCYKYVIMTRRSRILGDRPVGTSRVEYFKAYLVQCTPLPNSDSLALEVLFSYSPI